MQAQTMDADPNSDIPYGTEVFVIVPQRHAYQVMNTKNRLFDSLASEFPQFKFSLGRSVDDDPGEFVVIGVAGVVGDGWKEARPVVLLEEESRSAIVRHLDAFVANTAGKAN